MAKLLTSNELAEMLSVSKQYINESRVSGVLLGYPSPKHLKMGRTVRYELKTIEQWLEAISKEQSGEKIDK